MIDSAMADLAAALRADGAAAGAAMQQVWQQVQASAGGPGGAAVADAALTGLSGLFDGLPPGRGSRLAVLAGAVVEAGADPRPAVAPVVDGWLAAAVLATDFAARWKAAVGLAPPEPTDDPANFETVLGRLLRDDDGVEDLAAARTATAAWFMLGQWTMALTTFLQRAAVRTDLPRRDEVEETLVGLQDVRYDLDYLVDLLRVLDDEEIVVVHRPSGRGWRLVVGGVGDNFQLHTLLAGALLSPVDDTLLPGAPPRPEEVAAATDGPLRPQGGMNARFHLVDGEGQWIWLEGVPADIPVVDGDRLVVLDPLPEPRTWEAGRQFDQMVPTVRVVRPLTTDEAALKIFSVPAVSTPPQV
jgi:hypothetical protein